MDQASLRFLESLCNANGPSGYEREVAVMVKDYVQPYVDNLRTDKMGSLVFTREGSPDAPIVLLAAHMDEIGMVVSTVTEQGYLTFNSLGVWTETGLSGHKLIVLTRNSPVHGVIVAQPSFAQDPKASKPSPPELFIDIGASNRDEVKAMGIRAGDPVVPDSQAFTVTKPRFKAGKKAGTRDLLFGKAIDDRAGVFLAAEAMRVVSRRRVKHPNRLVGAATVQEEVGPRGAQTVANLVRPDVALVLDVDIAGDAPGLTPVQAPTVMGEGVSITVWDSATIPNQPLKELCVDLCEKKGIPYQLSHSKGWTDAAAIHMSGIGVPSIVLGPPVRHIHTHVGIMDLADVDATLALLMELVKVLDRDAVDGLTSLDGL
jgi:putative aminopeptidase FrvX